MVYKIKREIGLQYVFKTSKKLILSIIFKHGLWVQECNEVTKKKLSFLKSNNFLERA